MEMSSRQLEPPLRHLGIQECGTWTWPLRPGLGMHAMVLGLQSLELGDLRDQVYMSVKVSF